MTGIGIGAALSSLPLATIITGSVPSASAISATSRANQMFFSRSGGLVQRSVSRGQARLPTTAIGPGGRAASFSSIGTKPRSSSTRRPSSSASGAITR